jgi:hypothetical protein
LVITIAVPGRPSVRVNFDRKTDSDPFLGKHGQVETVNEFKVEMVCMQALQGRSDRRSKICPPL